jgi:WD40 repeat protein
MPAVIVWDVEAGRERRRLDFAEGPLAFSPDGRFLATGDAFLFGTVRVWDLTAGSAAYRTLTVSPGPLGSLAFSSDGRHFVAAGRQLSQQVFLMSQFIGSRPPPRPPASPPLPGGGALWWATDDWHEVGRVATGLSLLDTAAGFAAADRVAVSRQQLPLEVTVLGAATGTVQLTIPLPKGASNLEPAVTGAGLIGAIYYRNNFWATGTDRLPKWVPWSEWGRVRYLPSTVLYDAATGAEVARLPVDPNHAWLSPDGRTVVAWHDGQLTLWDVPPSRLTLTWAALSAAFAVLVAGAAWWRVRKARGAPAGR